MIKEKLAKLLSVKSIISISLTFVFCYLSFIKVISADLFVPIFMTVIAFYFGTQYEKKNNSTNE